MRLSTQQRKLLQDKGREYYTARMFDKALQVFDQLIQDGPTTATLDLRAATFERMGNLDSALKDGMEIIKLKKSLDHGYLRCGSILVKMDKPQKAIQVYESGLKRCKEAEANTLSIEAALKRLLSKTVNEKGIDFIGKQTLPLEVCEMIVEFLSFKDRCVCLRISKPWNSYLRGSYRFWQHIDLSSSKKPVPIKALDTYASYADGRTETMVLNKTRLQGNVAFRRLLRKCRRLRELELMSGGFLDQTIMDGIGYSPNISRFEASGDVHLSRRSVQSIVRQCPQLETLIIKSLVLDTERKIWEPQEEFPRLKNLCLYSDGSATPHIRTLAFLPPSFNLKRLVLLSRGVADGRRVSETLHKLRDLEELDLDNIDILISPDRTLDLPPSLKRLIIPNCRLTTDDRNLWLAMREENVCLESTQPLAQLEHFACNLRSDDGCFNLVPWARNMVKHSAGMKSLQILAGSISKEDFGKLLATESLRTLETLIVTNQTDLITDEVVEGWLEWFPKLAFLNISGSAITGVGVRRLIKGLPSLSRLYINYCQDVSADAIAWAREQGVVVKYHID